MSNKERVILLIIVIAIFILMLLTGACDDMEIRGRI